MNANHFDLLLKGPLLDDAQHINGYREIGIRGGRVAAVAERLPDAVADRVVAAPEGGFFSPGFIDIHAHVYAGVTSWGAVADPPCLTGGVTTVVDAGSPGWTMLQGFRWLIHERTRVRALCFLHISGVGLVNAWVNECEDLSHLHPLTVGEHAAENSDLVVGIKVRQGRQQVGDHGTEPLRRALEAAEISGTPVMCHIAQGIPLARVLEQMRAGDIITHCFQGRGGIGENVIDETGSLHPAAVEARARGVVMDVGHGGGSFRWEQAERALELGYVPDVVSTDLHAYNLHGPLYDMALTLTKFLHLGLPLDRVIALATSGPARAIRRPELGTLKPGSPADVTLFHVASEATVLWDTHGGRRATDRRIRVDAVWRDGIAVDLAALLHESEADITRRCRLRGPDGLTHSWRAALKARGIDPDAV